MARRATRGDSAQFTYDFGIAIAQSTVNKVARLTGVTLSLASAFYALKTTATEYVDTLRENTLRFGGMLSTMKAMQQAQDRLITGMSRFDVRDQMEGMNKLMAAGVDVKKNMDWIEKAAHATGKSFDQFSGMIAQAVQGNLQGLVDAGLMTQRATRAFTKFQGNTRMMQGAVMNFLRNHKGLMSAIKNDFVTIEDGVRRLKAIMTSFLQSIIGKPNDPNSLYGSVARVFNMIADKFGKDGVLSQNMKILRQYGEGVGIVMSWVVRKIGEVMIWLGRQAKKAMIWLLGDSETFAERMRSLVVWLEFWKLKVVDFFKEYGGYIKGVLKLLVAYQALKWAFVISSVAINSVGAYYKALKATYQLQMAYIAFQGPAISKTARWFQSLAVWMPRPFRKAWVASGKFLGLMTEKLMLFVKRFSKAFSILGKTLIAPFLGLKFALLHPIRTLKIAWYSLMTVISSAIYYPMNALYKLRQFIVGLPALIRSKLPVIKTAIFGFMGKLKNLFSGFTRGVVNFIMNLPALIMASAKSIGGALAKFARGIVFFLKNPIKTILMAYRYIKLFFTAIRAGIAAIYASNPVGWIILGITLLIMAYKKFAIVRDVVNNAFKMWWEWLKLLWNLIYGVFVYTVKGIKMAWTFFKEYIWNPIANFFVNAYKWIKDMWKAFMNTAVGRFINDYIVTPLRTLFEWILKGFQWILKGAAKILSAVNSSLAKNINETAAEMGLPQWAASGGNYDDHDTTDYLTMDALKGALGGEEPKIAPIEAPSKNPLLSEPSGNSGNGGGGTTNNISLSNGAVQIIVPKGTDIDEAKLARMVRDEIRNLDRESNMRGGSI